MILLTTGPGLFTVVGTSIIVFLSVILFLVIMLLYAKKKLQKALKLMNLNQIQIQEMSGLNYTTQMLFQLI